jgi:hypothetical protein
MAKIPTYDIPQVQPQLPGFSLGGGGTGRHGMEYFGEDLNKIAEFMRHSDDQANNLKLQEETDTARKHADDILQETQQITGRQTLDPDPSPAGDPNTDIKTSKLQQYDEVNQAIANQLNPQVRDRYLVNAGRIRNELDTQLTKHLNNQANVAFEEGFKNTENTETNRIFNLGVNRDGQPDWDVINSSHERMLANSIIRAEFYGKDIDVAEREANSRVYSTVINRMLDLKNPDGAMAIYEEHRTELNPEFQKFVEPIIQSQKQYYTAEKNAPYFIQKHAIPGTNQFDINAAMDDIAVNYPNMPKEQKQAFKSALIEKQSLIDKSNSTRIEGSTNEVLKVFIDTGSANAAINTPSFVNLRQINQKEAANLKQTLSTWENQELAKRQGLSDKTAWVGQDALLWRLTNNTEELRSMNAQQVYNPDIMLRLGEKRFGEFEKAWANSRSEKPINDTKEVKIPDHVYKDAFIAGGLGIPPKALRDKEVWQAKQLQLKRLIDDDVRALQTPQHPKATQIEIRDIVDKWTKKIQIDKTGWFGRKYQEEVRAFTVPDAVKTTISTPVGRQTQTKANTPIISLDEQSFKSLNDNMVKEGLLPPLKPGETINTERKAAIQGLLLKETPRPVNEEMLKQAQEAAMQGKTSESPKSTLKTAPAPQAKPSESTEEINRQIGKFKSTGTKIIAQAAKPLYDVSRSISQTLGVKYTDRAKAEYQKAIKEMTAVGVFKPGQALTNKDWDDVKAYIASKKGKK